MKAAKSLPPALLVTFNLFIFGPFLVFSSNSNEFLVSFAALMRFYILPSFLFFLTLALVPAPFPIRVIKLYTVLLFAFGFLLWIQSNFITWDYGPLNGQSINWRSFNWRAVIDVSFWVLTIGLFLRYRARLYSYIPLLSITIIFIQLISALYIGYQRNLLTRKPDQVEFAAVPDGMYHFSAKRNVIHLILDGFQSDIFQEIIDRDAQWRSRLSGFTFFPQATASYSNTFLSLPSLWSGNLFTNQRSIREYMSEALEGMNIPNALRTRGYRLDIATGTWWIKNTGKFSNYYEIPTPYTGNRRQYSRTSAAFLLDLAMFRAAPQPLKEQIYNGQSWFLTALLGKGPSLRYEHLAGNAFLRDITENALADGQEPVYKFIHLITPHPPLVVERGCGFSGKVLPLTRENFMNQAACTLNNVGEFLDRLKEMGIYDSALIMIHADHGADLRFRRKSTSDPIVLKNASETVVIQGAPFALLLIKPPDAKGEMRISESQVEMTDLPATVSSLLNLGMNFKGTPVFDVDSKSTRCRRYFGSENDGTAVFIRDSYDYLQEVLITGSVFEPSSWQIGPRHIDRRSSTLVKYDWNRKILFGAQVDSNKYMESGWSLPEESWAWSDGKRASLRIPVEKPESDVRLTINLVAFLVPGKLDRQRVGIWVNDQYISEWDIQVAEFHDESVIVPRQVFNDSGQLKLRFELPDSKAPVDLGTGKDIRSLAIAIHSVQLEK